MPFTKRQKMQGADSARVHDRSFASRTASFRRADSLRSVQGIDDGKACILHLSQCGRRDDYDCDLAIPREDAYQRFQLLLFLPHPNLEEKLPLLQDR
jgi:hypothetical protein